VGDYSCKYACPMDKCEYTEDSIYEELKRIFDQFPKHHMKLLLGDVNTKKTEKTFSNRQLGAIVYMKLRMIMKIESQTLPY
jgi:hypothetical protein